MHDEGIGRRQLVVTAVLVEGGLALLACLIGWLFGEYPWEHVQWNAAEVAWGLAATIPMLAAFRLCLRWPWGPLASIKQFSDNVIRPLFQPCSIFEIGLICLLAGLGEEMLFRGVIQPLLGALFGAWLGLGLTSLLFGLFHPITATYAVLATLLGVYLGWLALARDNLLVPILAHAVYDFIALVVISRLPGPRANTVGPGDPSGNVG